jgi:hypothetical protein
MVAGGISVELLRDDPPAILAVVVSVSSERVR